jgi:hypothetical protein
MSGDDLFLTKFLVYIGCFFVSFFCFIIADCSDYHGKKTNSKVFFIIGYFFGSVLLIKLFIALIVL